MRFVMLSFVFLGWAFWELSGGSEFEPRGVREAEPEKVAAVARPKPKQIVEVNAATLVAKPAVTQTSLKAAQKPEPAVETVEEELTSEQKLAQLARIRATLGDGLTLFPGDPGKTLTLASLEQGAASFKTVAVPEAETNLPETEAEPAYTPPEPDLREVAGTRVNMRDGPGTNYPVIARLNIGHTVEVLDESGDGWLRLRVLPEQHVGWIASSLISKKTN